MMHNPKKGIKVMLLPAKMYNGGRGRAETVKKFERASWRTRTVIHTVLKAHQKLTQGDGIHQSADECM